MVILLMGVAGSGKTTVGKKLAQALSCPFFDADDFHSPESREKMSQGLALTDSDRAPWLEKLSGFIQEWNKTQKFTVLACSALKQKYRIQLFGNVKILFVFLKGSPNLIRERLRNRKGHYFNPGLLESQFDELEEPEDAIMVDISQEVENIVGMLLQKLDLRGSR